MKHQAMLLKSTKCFYLCSGSSMKFFYSGIDKLQCTNMGITNFWSVEALYNLHINILIILRLLQGVNNHLTRLQQGKKHCKSMVFSTLHQTRLLKPEISISDVVA